jgi:glycosyltransferase involved in cell wall biosynthesis
MLASDFNKRLADLRPDISVQIGLPTAKAPDSDKEVFWLFWETNRLPTYPLKLLKTYGRVWTPSRWLTDILLKDGVDSRVVHVAVDPSEWFPAGNDHGTFRFLWVNEWIHRKGGDLLVEAFLDSFKSDDNVELVIKPKYTNQECAVRFPSVEGVIASSPSGPKEKIRIVNEFLTQEKLAALYRSCNCYVYPFRTQGASLTLLEAQACGLPAIATKYAGCLDYAIGDCTYFIEPAEYRPLTRMDFFSTYLSQGLGVEAVPNLGQLKEILRYCFEHPDEVASRGQRASEAVRGGFTWEGLKREVLLALEFSPRKHRMHFWR